MGTDEADFLYLVIAAFVAFSITLAWANWFDNRER